LSTELRCGGVDYSYLSISQSLAPLDVGAVGLGPLWRGLGTFRAMGEEWVGRCWLAFPFPICCSAGVVLDVG